MHQEETKANCARVRVIGFGRVMRIILEDVLDRIDVVYHAMHRI